MTVITRFAPSPTGYLHIGGARTALFNYLFSKHHGGKFLLRIEDTDRERSTPQATQAILDGLQWLGLPWDEEPVFQFSRAARHAEVAQELVKQGKAFHCYTTPQELEEFRKANPNAKFRSPWRDRTDAPVGVKPAIRLKAPLTGAVVVKDKVRGEVTVQAEELDDMVLLRADGNPTYMLAVVVDDHDMNITHVIRGDDHFTNTFRQTLIYQAMGWQVPEFAHIPLIHGPDGAKLSKRHGALGVEAYREMGYLPEALRNYLLRLGWAHGDDEIISDKQAIEWFDLGGIGVSPSRFDFAKLENLNGHYIREASDERLVELLMESGIGNRESGNFSIPDSQFSILLRGMPGLKARAKTLKELAASARFYLAPQLPDEKAKEVLDKGKTLLGELIPALEAQNEWKKEAIEAEIRRFAGAKGEKLGNLAQPLRAALTGSLNSPPIFEVMEVLGKKETLERLGNI